MGKGGLMMMPVQRKKKSIFRFMYIYPVDFCDASFRWIHKDGTDDADDCDDNNGVYPMVGFVWIVVGCLEKV